MQIFKGVLFSVFVLLISLSSLKAQRPGGGGPPGGGPEEMVSREKQALYEQITDLSDDQTALLDGIYDEFATTLKEAFEESRGSNDREARREQMQALRQEKDELIADVLNEEQYAIYEKLAIRRNRRDRESEENQPE
ncbi:hypothetical protein OKW21_004564 [Catalinimonas alkaloidigena]|uniref:hypothetical protein n=1 Tax=Catalinimonas alkaloidigena TaxID=1075417 RepID=UPI0024074EAF|nr:hypothetical protein [Catalinimonas alkaloidigena]MDF9799301.1 hypothetical protein [Catalinimonas alkaloidigena]